MSEKNEWITVREAVQLSKYNEEYITQLCREGKIEARKYVTLWQINRKSLLNYMARVNKKGEKRGPKV